MRGDKYRELVEIYQCAGKRNMRDNEDVWANIGDVRKNLGRY